MISHGKDIKIFTGNANPKLAADICKIIGTKMCIRDRRSPRLLSPSPSRRRTAVSPRSCSAAPTARLSLIHICAGGHRRRALRV